MPISNINDIVKLNKSTYYFAVNLNNKTIDPEFMEIIKPEAYLVSPDYLTKTLKKKVVELISEGYHVIIDNGNFDEISKISSEYSNQAKTIDAKIVEIEKKTKKKIRKENIPPDIQKDLINLYQSIESHTSKPINRKDLQDILKLNPSAIVGTEDITAAIWLKLGQELQYLPDGRTKIHKKNTAVCNNAINEIKDIQTEFNERYLTVISALDYDSAFDAGSECASHGVKDIAMGFGAYMSDNSFSDYIIIGGKEYNLGFLAAMRYLRTSLVLRGFWDGYKSLNKKDHLRSFHFLGLGFPMMIPIAALAAYSTNLLTYDATSPIKDAVQGHLYITDPAYLKLRTLDIAFKLASKTGETWLCSCEFCKKFLEEYPMDYKEGNEWFRNTSPKQVELKDLQPEGVLYDVYPLLGEPSSGDRRNKVNECRIGHNHWVLDKIFSEMHDNSKSKKMLEEFVKTNVDKYVTNSNWLAAKRSVNLAFNIVQAEDINDIATIVKNIL